jgi:hypothetical protein
LAETISGWPYLNLTVAVLRAFISSFSFVLELLELNKDGQTAAEDVLLEQGVFLLPEVTKTTKLLLPMVKIIVALVAMGFHILKAFGIFR